MGKASSAKKVARLAERGKGKKARIRGGGVFPIVVAAIVVLGTLLVVYARSTNKADASGPQPGDHWHLGYGIYLCDHYLDPFQDDKEGTQELQELQIHSHGDGIMHWHSRATQTTGRRATFDDFLGMYGVDVSDSKLKIDGTELTPPSDDLVYEEGETTCTVGDKQEKGSLRVLVWERYDSDSFIVRTSSLGKERIDADKEVFVIAFVPDSVANNAIPKPDWVIDLPVLAGVDDPNATTTTVAPTSVAPTSVAPEGASATTTPRPTAAATTSPATTSAPSTSG